MQDFETFDAPPDFGPDENLRGQFEGLRKLFIATLVALLILGISFNVFLLRQTALVRNDLQNARPQVNQLVASFEKNEEPQLKSFVNALVGFSQTHPDFKPILTKYNIATQNPATNALEKVPVAPVKK